MHFLCQAERKFSGEYLQRKREVEQCEVTYKTCVLTIWLEKMGEFVLEVDMVFENIFF